MTNYFFNNQHNREQSLYTDLLTITGSLSRLFSDSENPFLYYRAAENIFCKSFNATNLSRSDVSADASKDQLGIGLKTFLHNNGNTFQKVAEFNKESNELNGLNHLDIIYKIASMRNERIQMTKRTLNLEDMIYHLVTREKNKMLLFEEYMDEVDLDSIKLDAKQSSLNTIRFSDRYNEYSFSLSKNTLLKRFITSPEDQIKTFEVKIHEDPFEFLFKNKEELLSEDVAEQYEYIVLPLYSARSGNVEEKSGLNAWNAKPRASEERRNPNEIYIPVPAWIHQYNPAFFNYAKDVATKDLLKFKAELPNGEVIPMMLTQSGGKAISSDPLSILGDWILRDVLNVEPGTLITRSMLNIIGIDSVKLTKVSETYFLLDFTKTGSFEDFQTSIENKDMN